MSISVSARLKELGYDVPPVAKPLAAYVPAVKVGTRIWTSGQLPIRDGKLVYKGKVGREISLEQGIEAARICALNALAAAGSACGGVDNILRIVKAVVFINAVEDFEAHPKLANGASDMLAMVFSSEGQHVRSAVGVASLPMGAPVEIELVVEYREHDEEIAQQSAS